MELNKMTKFELLAECKNLGITKVSSKNKTQLLELINASKTNNATKKKIVIEEVNVEEVNVKEVNVKEVSDINLLSILISAIFNKSNS